MIQKNIITDLHECRKLWRAFVKPRSISDTWEFRLCFHRYFQCKPHFLILQDRKGIAGMLPLSYSEELGMVVFFPGEAWHGKTWIERTPVFVRRPEFLPDLLSSCPEGAYLRYMDLCGATPIAGLEQDEIGYVLYPPEQGFDFLSYRKRFSNKRFKSILKTIHALTEKNGRFRFNRLEDFDTLSNLSIQNFGSDSYMYDYRFRESARDLVDFLNRNGWLYMVSLEIGGETVAVDMGVLYEGTYTVFLGGTHPAFPGVAKVMNMHHIEMAYDRGIRKVDFLCGDFHWKKLWHLDPEPLYKYVTPSYDSEDHLEENLITDTLGYVREGLRLA